MTNPNTNHARLLGQNAAGSAQNLIPAGACQCGGDFMISPEGEGYCHTCGEPYPFQPKSREVLLVRLGMMGSGYRGEIIPLETLPKKWEGDQNSWSIEILGIYPNLSVATEAAHNIGLSEIR